MTELFAFKTGSWQLKAIYIFFTPLELFPSTLHRMCCSLFQLLRYLLWIAFPCIYIGHIQPSTRLCPLAARHSLSYNVSLPGVAAFTYLHNSLCLALNRKFSQSISSFLLKWDNNFIYCRVLDKYSELLHNEVIR